MNIGTFDFSNLRTNPPKGFVVERADTELHLRWTKNNTLWTVKKHGGEFLLHRRNPEVESEPQFVMRAELLTSVLHPLGYGRNRG